MPARIQPQQDATAATLRFDVIDARAAERGISKGALAEQAGVNQSTIWRYRRGMSPRLSVIDKIAQVLSLPIGDITRQGKPTPSAPAGPSAPRPPAGPKAD